MRGEAGKESKINQLLWGGGVVLKIHEIRKTKGSESIIHIDGQSVTREHSGVMLIGSGITIIQS